MEKFDNDILLRLPLKLEYLPIIRATTGVVAGVIAFNYDEMMQLRVAVSELFDLAIKHVTARAESSEANGLTVHFLIHPDKIQILVTSPKDFTSYLSREEGKESLALLRSLTDEVEFCTEVVGKTLVRMVKYKSSMGGT